MGEIAPPAILHSTDINRSSQDTQQLRASQTEPVRHGAGGAGLARGAGGHTQQGTILYNRRSQGLTCQKKKDLTAIAFSHICKTFMKVKIK